MSRSISLTQQGGKWGEDERLTLYTLELVSEDSDEILVTVSDVRWPEVPTIITTLLRGKIFRHN